MLGTIIYSDKYKTYVSGLTDQFNLETLPYFSTMNYTHRWVNHSDYFVDPATGVHTQMIEGCWQAKIKYNLKKMNGVKSKESLFPSYLKQFMWKDNYPDSKSPDDVFIALCNGIKQKYPL